VERSRHRLALNLQPLYGSPLAWILWSAALIRLVYFLQVRSDASFTVPIWDAAVFDEIARSLAAGHGTGFPKAFFFGPLYPYFLGAVYTLTGASAAVAILLQHGLGVVLCGLTYRLGRDWVNHETGLLAAGLMAVSGPQIFFEGTLLMEVLVSVLLAVQTGLLLRSDPGTSRRKILAAGILLGLAATGRPTLLLAAVLYPLGLVFRRPTVGRAALFAAAVYLAGVALAPSVTMIRNYRVEQVLVPITSSGGFNFYLGNAADSQNLFFDKKSIATDSSWNGEDSAETAVGRQLDSAAISRYWTGRALAKIQAEPLAWCVRYLKKAQLFLNGQDIPQIESYQHARRRSSLLAVTPLGLHLFMALAVAGMVGALPRYRRMGALYGLVGVIILTTAAFFVTTRYRIIALPYLSIFAAYFILLCGHAVRKRRWRHLLLLVGIGAAAGLFTLPARFPINERMREYVQHLHDGFRYAKVEQYPQAVDAYIQARDTWPEDYESYLWLGTVQRTLGQLPQSLQALETAMRYNTDDAEVPYHLGVTLFKMNRFTAAEQALRESLRIAPRRALTHTYLGLALAAQGRYEPSRQAFRESLELDPFQAFTHSNYGTLLAMLGERPAARTHLLRALELDPRSIHARRNLAYVYLDDGDTAGAARELRRILNEMPEDREARELLESLGR